MNRHQKQSGRKTISLSNGFSAVELLITLIIASVFLISGYQLYSLIVKDGGEARTQSVASNIASDYLQRYKSSAQNPCAAQTPVNNQPITNSNLSNATMTVAISCPYSSQTSVNKLTVTILYGSPQQTLINSTYVTP